MATPEEVCNLALSNVQISNFIADLATDRTKEAIVCRLWYASTLLYMLEDFDWNCARRRIPLTEVVSTQKPDYWTYAYSLPSACAKPRWIEVPGVRTPYNEQRIRFEVAGENGSGGDTRVIYSNLADAILVYTKHITDAGLFDAHFTHVFGWLLGANISGPLAVKQALTELAAKQYASMRYNMIASDMGEGLEDVDPPSETERARNG